MGRQRQNKRVAGVGGALPGLAWMRSYRAAWFRPDLVAAVVVWALLVPEAVAYAHIIGIPPQYAFSAAAIALVIYAFLGTSSLLSLGASSAIAVMTASALSQAGLHGGDLVRGAAIVGLVAGIILLLLGLLRMGFVTRFLPEPLPTGFLFGASLIIIIWQVPDTLGVPAGSGGFVPRLMDVWGRLGDTHWPTVWVSLAAAALLLGLKKWAPRVPAAIVVLALAVVASSVWDFRALGVATVGALPSGLVGFAAPSPAGVNLMPLILSGAGIALVCYAQSYAVATKMATATGEQIDGNRELVALGVANIAAGFFQGFPVAGSTSRSAAAAENGGRTQASGLMVAVMVVLTAFFLMPLFRNLPITVLAVVVIVSVSGYLTFGLLLRFWRYDRRALVICLAAVLGVLFLGLLSGLLVAIGVAMVTLMWYVVTRPVAVLGVLPDTVPPAYVDVSAHPAARALPETIVALQPSSSLFFGNAEEACEQAFAIAVDRSPRVVILDLELSEGLGLQTCETIAGLVTQLKAHGIALILCGIQGSHHVRLAQAGVPDLVGAENIVASVDDAVRRAESLTA